MEISKMSSEPSTSSDPSLLYSEFVNTDPVEHIVEAAENKKKGKPVIKFTKSLVLARVMGLLSAMKESEKELKKKPEKERNIEICEEGAPVVEMNVAILKESTDDKSSTAIECTESSSESSDSDDSDNDTKTDLPECLSGIFKKDASDNKLFKLVATEPTISESSTAVECTESSSKSSDSDDSDNDTKTDLPECLSGIFKKDASDNKLFKLVATEPTTSESSGSPSEEKVFQLSKDLKSENIIIENTLTNSELEQPPAKKICVM